MNSPDEDLVHDLVLIAAALVAVDPRRWSEEIKSLTAWADDLAARVAVVRPTREQIRMVICESLPKNHDATLDEEFDAVDELARRGWLAVSDSQETPE